MIILFIFSSFESCDFKDIDRRLFIVAVGIDSTGNKGEMEVSFKAAIPKSIGGAGQGGGDGQNFNFFTVRGNSLGEIFRELKAQVSMEPDYAHMKLILFGESYVKTNDIHNIINFFIRRRDFQNIAYVAVGVPKASEILKFQPPGELFAGNKLFMKFGTGVNSEYMIDTKLKDIRHSDVTPGLNMFCPLIKFEKGKLVLQHLVLFDEGKADMVLNKEETKLFKLLFKGIQNGYLIINTSDSENPLGIDITQGKSSIKLKEENNDILCDVEIKIKAVLEEQVKYMEIEETETMAEAKLNSEVKRLLLKLQEKGLDPLQLQIKYWANHRNYEFSEEWLDNEYRKISFNVKSKIKIMRSGNLK